MIWQNDPRMTLGNGIALLNMDFGTGGGKTKTSVVADPYGRLREPFVNYLTGQVGKSGPKYQGQLTAEMTPQEQQSISKVSEYANTGYGDTFRAGQKQIQDTLSGNYDPTTSPYYQAVKAASAKNLEETQRNIASNAGGGGRYYTGARLKAQGDAATDRALALDTLMGQLAEKERQNQISLIPQAMAYGEAERNLPLSQATALQTLGGLPRQLQQDTLDKQREEFYKSEYDYPLNWANLIAGVQTPPVYSTQQKNSGLQNATQAAVTAATLAAMMCWVASEVLADGDMNDPRVNDARYFVNHISPKWFRELYKSKGYKFSLYIKNKPFIKITLRPLFEMFSFIGKINKEKNIIDLGRG